MCFLNDIEQLNQMRAKKTRIKVWKTGRINPKTGRVNTTQGDNRVEWVQGQIARPHKILKPLKKGQYASAGLYFYTTDQPVPGNTLTYSTTITATVNPKDVIAVNSDGTTICVTAAKVTKAPNPDQKAMRIKFLKQKLKKSKDELGVETLRRKIWNDNYEDREEAVQQMNEELATLNN